MNLDKPRGPIVTCAQVALYALDGHQKCARTPGMLGVRPCPCAMKRFLRKNIERVILDDAGRAWWIAGKQPNAQVADGVRRDQTEAPDQPAADPDE
jgi:hypothetical protein